MRVTDIIFALISGRIIGWLLGDILREWDIKLGLEYHMVIWIVLPFLAVFILWIFAEVGKRFLFAYQGAKHLLVGAVATVIDLKFFEWSLWALSFFVILSPLAVKGVSFLLSTFIKFWGNKYWAFGKHEKEDIRNEMVNFFFITFVGLLIDVALFYYFSRVLAPQLIASNLQGFELSMAMWLKLSVIAAALGAAVWNFIGYKFFVFKK